MHPAEILTPSLVCSQDGNTPLMWTLRGQSSSHRAIIDRLLIEGVDVTLANQVRAAASYYE